MLGLPHRPAVETRPLADVVAGIRRHNEAALAKLYLKSSTSDASSASASTTSGIKLKEGEPALDPIKQNDAVQIAGAFLESQAMAIVPQATPGGGWGGL